ncbi:hypothetical protein OB956_09220 [Aeromonas dhakensis]|uniref:hypothetical protein n=1 Tax=Aeromonas dhakensis TaxID=196024 RepID=UPI00259DF126|nr:hypothetical protein [Aeromonas dhakensis]MDM5054459.1 hypothetical protein [Aeromonas dhakensis]MDM5080722.1 hypothetical protein [Aeromonas dhakensis]
MRIFINQLINFFSFLVSVFVVGSVCFFWASNYENSVMVSVFSGLVLCMYVFGGWYIIKEKREGLRYLGVKYITPTWFGNVRGFANAIVNAISSSLFVFSLIFIIERESTYTTNGYVYSYSFSFGMMFLSIFFLIGLPMLLNFIGACIFKASIEADNDEFLKINGINTEGD